MAGWFNAVRVLMLLSVIGSGFGVVLIITAMATNRAKKSGSRMWVAGLLVFIAGTFVLTKSKTDKYCTDCYI